MTTLLIVSFKFNYYAISSERVLIHVDYLDWGQNSYGAANGNDPSGWQQPLRFYCNDDSVDVLPIAFLNTFFGVGGEPQINLANVSVLKQEILLSC